MNRKLLLGIILGFTVFVIALILILTYPSRYHKLVVSQDKWNRIMSDKKESDDISLERIRFNGYYLEIDSENSILYYSVVRSSRQNNPSIQFQANQKNVKIAINQDITNDVYEQSDVLKIMLYNDSSYHVYSLVVTDYPILSIHYDEHQKNKTFIPIQLELFDNHVDSARRVLKSEGKLRIIEENQSYRFSLVQESLGHNKRDNPVSIFGMPKQDEYVITYAEKGSKNGKYVQVFMNHQYIGLYSLGQKEKEKKEVRAY